MTILAPATNPSDVFSFESTDGSGNPADIDTIQVAGNVGGTIRVRIGPDPGTAHSYGADDVRVIDLSNASTGEIVSLDLDGDLGRIQSQPAGHVTVDAVTGTWTLGNLYNSLALGDISGSITANSLISGATLTASSLTGSLTASNAGGGSVTVNGSLSGTIDFDSTTPFGGVITVHGNVTSTGQIHTRRLDGRIEVDGDLVASSTNRILVSGQVINGDLGAAILIRGSLIGSGSVPLIKVTGAVENTIGIHGSLTNANTTTPNGYEIETAAFADTGSTPPRTGAIAINYDGAGDADGWVAGAEIRVGSTTHSAPNAGAHVWAVSPCKGDFNSDFAVNSSDSPLLAPALNAEDYYEDFPGLEGSRVYHGDCNFDGSFNQGDDPASGNSAFDNLVAQECCATNESHWCGGDTNSDFVTDLTDLAVLLSHFGTSSGATREQGDLDGDGDVHLADLATLLSNFGGLCCPEDGGIPLMDDPSITVAGFDTGFYTSGDFGGEKDDWVFDVMVEMDDTDDDWLGAGAKVTTANGATFRIVGGAANPPTPGSSAPGLYRCFFSAPYAVADSDRYDAPFPSGGVKGKYNPLASTRVYSASELNANWYDAGASNDGPAAIMRIVIDVSGVSGSSADEFGEVYFTTGSPRQRRHQGGRFHHRGLSPRRRPSVSGVPIPAIGPFISRRVSAYTAASTAPRPIGTSEIRS